MLSVLITSRSQTLVTVHWHTCTCSLKSLKLQNWFNIHACSEWWCQANNNSWIIVQFNLCICDIITRVTVYSFYSNIHSCSIVHYNFTHPRLHTSQLGSALLNQHYPPLHARHQLQHSSHIPLVLGVHCQLTRPHWVGTGTDQCLPVLSSQL